MATGGDPAAGKRRSRALRSWFRAPLPRTRDPEWSIEADTEPAINPAAPGSLLDTFSHGDLLASLERELGRLRVENRELRTDLETHVTAVAALRATEEHYRNAFLAAPIALIEADAVGTVTLCSRATAALFRSEASEIIGKPVWQLAGSEAARETLRELLVARGRKRTHESRPLSVDLRRGDGTSITVEIFHSLQTDDRSRTIGSVMSMIDASDRARREGEIEASANAYRDLFDYAPVMLLAVDARTTTVLECNAAVLAATGYSREEMLDRSIFDLYDPRSLDDAAEAFRAFLHNGESVDVNLRVRSKHGTTFAVAETSSAVADEGGAILACRVAWRATEAAAKRAVAQPSRRAAEARRRNPPKKSGVMG